MAAKSSHRQSLLKKPTWCEKTCSRTPQTTNITTEPYETGSKLVGLFLRLRRELRHDRNNGRKTKNNPSAAACLKGNLFQAHTGTRCISRLVFVLEGTRPSLSTRTRCAAGWKTNVKRCLAFLTGDPSYRSVPALQLRADV